MQNDIEYLGYISFKYFVWTWVTMWKAHIRVPCILKGSVILFKKIIKLIYMFNNKVYIMLWHVLLF